MRASSAVGGGLVAVGAVVVAVEAVRSAILWIVEPGSEYVAPAGALLVGAGVTVLALRYRGRPVVVGVALALSGLAATALARLVGALATTTGTARVVLYGPGSAPSLSWSLLATQVLGPALAVLGALLVIIGAIRASALLAARVGRRLRAG